MSKNKKKFHKLTELEIEIIELLPEWGYGEPGLSTREVADNMGLDVKEALKILQKLNEINLVRKRPGKGTYKWFRTEKASKLLNSV